MIRLLFALALFSLPAMAAEESSVRSYDDYIAIKYIPGMGGFKNAEPVMDLKATSHTYEVKATGEISGTNDFIKNFHEKVKRFEDSGAHLPVYPDDRYTKLEVSYKGDVVTLEYGGPSNDAKFADAEKEWNSLYSEAYDFITANVKPGSN